MVDLGVVVVYYVGDVIEKVFFVVEWVGVVEVDLFVVVVVDFGFYFVIGDVLWMQVDYVEYVVGWGLVVD